MSPRATSASVRCEPMKPAPPVIRYFTSPALPCIVAISGRLTFRRQRQSTPPTATRGNNSPNGSAQTANPRAASDRADESGRTRLTTSPLLSGGLTGGGYETLLVTGRVGRGRGGAHRPRRNPGPLPRPARPGHPSTARPRGPDRADPRWSAPSDPTSSKPTRRRPGCWDGWRRCWRRRPRPVVIHTYHGHVLRGYFGPPEDRGLPRDRAGAGPGQRPPDRRQRRDRR